MSKLRSIVWVLLCLIVPTSASVSAPQLNEDIASDEEIYMFPTYGRLEDDRWRIPIHTWVFEFEEDSLLRAPIRATVRAVLGSAVNKHTKTLFKKRMTWALVDNERGKRIRFQTPVPTLTRESAPNGQTITWINLPAKQSTGPHPTAIALTTAPTADGRVFQGETILVPPQGFSVISDIDDTIKHSNVLQKLELLRNSLVRPYRPIHKLRQLFAKLEADHAAFHYVSSSPRFLCPTLVSFFEKAGIPKGSMHLKQVRFTDASLYALFEPSTGTKPPAIADILKDFPGRRFILVGDAGESDPEIYRQFAKSHPEQVAFVLIRRVRRTPSEDKRIHRIFEGWPKMRWALFDDEKSSLASIYEQIRAALITPYPTAEN